MPPTRYSPLYCQLAFSPLCAQSVQQVHLVLGAWWKQLPLVATWWCEMVTMMTLTSLAACVYQQIWWWQSGGGVGVRSGLGAWFSVVVLGYMTISHFPTALLCHVYEWCCHWHGLGKPVCNHVNLLVDVVEKGETCPAASSIKGGRGVLAGLVFPLPEKSCRTPMGLLHKEKEHEKFYLTKFSTTKCIPRGKLPRIIF